MTSLVPPEKSVAKKFKVNKVNKLSSVLAQTGCNDMSAYGSGDSISQDLLYGEMYAFMNMAGSEGYAELLN